MKNMKRTKIVATIGPSSEKPKVLEEMIENGMNVARINFSHGTHESNEEAIDAIRKISEKKDIPVGIVADLQGPRIRTIVEQDLEIKKGEKILISDRGVFRQKDVSAVCQKEKEKKTARRQMVKGKYFLLDWPGIIKGVRVGNHILVEDGLMRLKVIAKKKEYMEAEVIEGGIIKNHKGVNIPDARLKMDILTEKDKDDLAFALKKEVDFVALSFVSNAKEINEIKERIKKILKRKNDLPQIISKIERKEAINNIDKIVAASDIIMVARGDLGIELEESKVVIFQKEIITKCLKSGKPVIVATQMLNSMIENARPTRAEVSDVSNAVIDHTDAVMLSGETANGKYPVESVRTMREIIEQTEGSSFVDLEHGFLGDAKSSVSAAVANSAHELSKDSSARAILVGSISGFTARMIARHRPDQEIYVMTNSEKAHNQLSILWGTISFVLPDCVTLDSLIDRSIRTLLKRKLLSKKDKVVIVTGRPHVQKEHMSLVKVEEIK